MGTSVTWTDLQCAWIYQVTVLSIAALKKVTKGTRILLLDRNSGMSKAIAKDLSRRGFNRVRAACRRVPGSCMHLQAVPMP